MNRLPGLIGLHHVGIAVADLDAAVDRYCGVLGADAVELRAVVPDQGVEAVSLHLGAQLVELITPHGEASALRRFLERRGEGLHHVAWAVERVEDALQALRGRDVRLIDEAPRIGLHGVPVAFVHPSGMNGVLTELVEGAPHA